MIYILFELSITGWIYIIKVIKVIKVELDNAILYHYSLQEIRGIITPVKIKFVI